MLKYSHNLEFNSPDYASHIRFSFPAKQKPNNISFKNSVHLINSEKKPDNHRQYLIEFIRDNNNNKNKNSVPKQTSQKYNSTKSSKIPNRIEEKKVEDEETIDENYFFNDFFNHQIKLEKENYNKLKKTDELMDICDYIGEDSRRPVELEIMNIKMNNFIQGRISSKSFGLINSYAANTNQGIDRNYNDDRVKIMINMNRPQNYISKSPWPLISYFGIFDGHNGDQCAEFLRQNLLQYIYTNPDFPKNIEKSIKEAFIQADEDFLRNKNINYNYNINFDTSGSCGLILLIVDTKIYIANVGDSRCVVSCQNGKIQRDVTRDHKPEFPYEKKRIYNNGGNIYRNETVFDENYQNGNNKILLGPYRVNPGKLSVSRTIGDARAKLTNLGGIPNVISPEPDIYVFDFYKDDIDYFILGCDGIFDRLKSSEVFKCANIIIDKSRELLEKNIEYNNYFNTYYDKIINMHTTCGNVVDMILRLSMLRKSYDNVTCIMVAFKDLLYNNNSNFENSRDFKRKENIYENKPNLKNLSFGLHKAHLNKDINTINNENKEPQDNITNRRQYGNYRYLEDNDELDINKENKLRRKNNNSLDKEKEIENEIREGRERDKEIKNRRFIPSQSQEKKIRELISLFSMNNRKGNNNDSKFLYNSYNSTESLNNTKINSNNISNIEKGKDDDIPNNSRKAKIVFNQINNDSKKNNIYILKDSSNSKEEAELEDENNNFIAKRKKVLVLKKKDLDLSINENKNNNYSYIKKYNSISKRIGNTKMNSFLKEKDKERFSINTSHITPNNPRNNDNNQTTYIHYSINNISHHSNKVNNTMANRLKSNSTDSLFDDHNKNEALLKRITTRKIVRKTNNYFNTNNANNELREKINKGNVYNHNNNPYFKYTKHINYDNNNLTLNAKKNNFFYSTTCTHREKNNELQTSRENIINKISPINSSSFNMATKKNNINFKNRNLRYLTNLSKTRDYQISFKEKYDDNTRNLNKSGKYEKNKKMENENLLLSSSVGLIYTKKNKIK
jgi:serine/threonine protein phosphatase PrpC